MPAGKLDDINTLLESIKVELDSEGEIQIVNLSAHLDRLFLSLKDLDFEGLASLEELLEKELINYVKSELKSRDESQIYKLRLMVDRSGSYKMELEPYQRDLNKDWRVKILNLNEYHIDSANTIHRHKYLTRPEFNYGDYDELIWLNEKGHICEGSFTNVFFYDGETWHTPHISCGILPGTMRAQYIIELKDQGYTVHEGFYEQGFLASAQKIVLTNALIGTKEICYDTGS